MVAGMRRLPGRGIAARWKEESKAAGSRAIPEVGFSSSFAPCMITWAFVPWNAKALTPDTIEAPEGPITAGAACRAASVPAAVRASLMTAAWEGPLGAVKLLALPSWFTADPTMMAQGGVHGHGRPLIAKVVGDAACDAHQADRIGGDAEQTHRARNFVSKKAGSTPKNAFTHQNLVINRAAWTCAETASCDRAGALAVATSPAMPATAASGWPLTEATAVAEV
ncbi:MAG: hypothetical protein FRX49_03368 [Trebouxia sp. A1-2]|nr:MAG: hypothetical protein FRX49_03368 [Trebouxia sp. A1-2]